MIADKVNPVFSLITKILAELGNLEKQTMLERQAEGIAIAKKKGDVYKGRIKGTKQSNDIILKKYHKVVRILKSKPNLSLQHVADICMNQLIKMGIKS